MRTLRIIAVAALLLAGLTGVTTEASAAPVPRPPTPWGVAATLGLGLDDVSLSCPTVHSCVAAAGGQLLTSSDGGAGWDVRTDRLPDDVAAIVDLDCPSTSVCVLLARRADGTTAVLTGPATGPTTELDGPDTGTATAIDCPAPSHCVVTDGTKAWTTRDRGLTWRASALPRIAYSDQQITCVDGTYRCTVFGNAGFTPVVDVTTDDGRTWTQQIPGSFDGLYALDCPTVTVCVAGGRTSGSARMTRTTDGGATWQVVTTPGQPYGVRSVACATATACSAFGLTPGDSPYAWSTTNGTTWSAQPVAVVETSPSPEVDCPAAGRCRAVGGGVAYVTDDGATWQDQSLPASPQVPRAISCPRASACVAVGVDTVQRPLALTSTDSGATWSQHPLPAGVGQPSDVDCVLATSTCVLVGAYAPPGNGRTVLRGAVSTDLGVTWTASRETAVQGYLWSVSCATTTTCLAGGYDRRSTGLLWLTTDGAKTWKVLTPPAGLSQDNAVSCTGPTTCVVVSNPNQARPVAFVTHDLGATWRSRVMPGDPDFRTYYTAVDCATTTCVAVGFISGSGAIARSTDGGTTWQRSTVPVEAQLVGAVSCASDAVCGATSYDFRSGGGPVAIGTRDAGTTWTPHPLDAGNLTGSDISCAGGRCYVPQVSPFGNPVVVSGAP